MNYELYDGQVEVRDSIILPKNTYNYTGIQYIAIGRWLWDEKDLPI